MDNRQWTGSRGRETIVQSPTSTVRRRGDPDGETTIQKNIYDALGRRVKKHIDTAAPGSPDGIDTYQHMYYNTGWQLLETRETDTESTAPDTLAPQYQFVWSTRYIDSPILREDFTVYGVMDGRIYYLTDANFNVTALVDEVEVDSWQVVERYAYDPYGSVTVLDGGPGDPDNPATEPGGEGDTEWDADPNGVSDHLNPILYCGYYYDLETGLYHVRNRSYHPHLGRWVQRDPEGYVDGMSLYEYVGGRPGTARDPMGEEAKDHGHPGKRANCHGYTSAVLAGNPDAMWDRQLPGVGHVSDPITMAEWAAAFGSKAYQTVLKTVGVTHAQIQKDVEAQEWALKYGILIEMASGLNAKCKFKGMQPSHTGFLGAEPCTKDPKPCDYVILVLAKKFTVAGKEIHLMWPEHSTVYNNACHWESIGDEGHLMTADEPHEGVTFPKKGGKAETSTYDFDFMLCWSCKGCKFKIDK